MIESSQVLQGLFIGRDEKTRDLFSRNIELSRGVDGSATVRLFTSDDMRSLLASVNIPAPAGDELLAAFIGTPKTG